MVQVEVVVKVEVEAMVEVVVLSGVLTLACIGAVGGESCSLPVGSTPVPPTITYLYTLILWGPRYPQYPPPQVFMCIKYLLTSHVSMSFNFALNTESPDCRRVRVAPGACDSVPVSRSKGAELSFFLSRS